MAHVMVRRLLCLQHGIGRIEGGGEGISGVWSCKSALAPPPPPGMTLHPCLCSEGADAGGQGEFLRG